MPKNYVYTDLSAKNSVFLQIGDKTLAVAQFTAAWAANEVPTASVMLPVGRDVKTRKKAEIHEFVGSLRQMEKATVWFRPSGEFDRDVTWPNERVKIFDGFFTGFAYRKVSGRINVICNLLHWAAALSFSSALTKNSHPINPVSLNTAAVLQSLSNPGAAKGNNVSEAIIQQHCVDDVRADLWVAIKKTFCGLANVAAMVPSTTGAIEGSGQVQKNDVALAALNRIEGPAPGCNRPYKYGVPLKIESEGVPTIEDAIASGLGITLLESYAGTTFWDKLIGDFCPSYGMAFVPMVDTAIVVADTPAYNGAYWKEITSDDYDSYDMSKELHRPLRAVVVSPSLTSHTGLDQQGKPALPFAGGAFAEDSVSAADGMVMYIDPPTWLRGLQAQPNYAQDSTGLRANQPIKGATTPNAKSPPQTPVPDTFGLNANKLYARYARMVYVTQALRGQNGSFSGKLRFDIAPLSIVRLSATTEKFIGKGQDDLAFDVFGCVQRVTVLINAEAGMAGTTFALSHVRTEAENSLPRTSVSEHPLFGKAIHGNGRHGSPLIESLDNLLVGDGPVPPPVTA